MILFAALVLLMVLVVVYDATRYIIPNWLNGLVLLLYPFHVATATVAIDWRMALLGMLVMFVVGFFTYAMKWMGAGDVKLLAALAPWVGWGKGLLEYALYVAVAGGALSLALILIRKLIPWIMKLPDHPYTKILREGSPVPYGLAIAGVFLGFLLTARIPGIAY